MESNGTGVCVATDVPVPFSIRPLQILNEAEAAPSPLQLEQRVIAALRS